MKNEQIPEKIISWREIDIMTYYLYYQIKASGYKPDHIFGIHRGGMILAIRLSHLLKVPCHAIAATHWPENKKVDKVTFARHILYIAKFKRLVKGKILICDDLADSGKSFVGAIKKILNKFRYWKWFKWHNQITDYKTVAYFYKKCSKFKPDFLAGDDIEPNEDGKYPWIDFPWEQGKVPISLEETERQLKESGFLTAQTIKTPA